MTPAIGRRGLAALPFGALTAPALAQQPPALPCPSQPNDIVGLFLEGTGAPAGTVTVFGQAFRTGHLPRGAGLGARSTAGARLRAQCDVKTRHPDGSARHAIIALEAPALAAGARLAVMLHRAPAANEPALDVATAAARHRAVLILNDRTRIDLVPTPADASSWQAGPLAVQGRITMPVPGVGVTSLRLVADVAVRSDGSLWVEHWLRNDGAMRPGGGPATYSMRLLLNDREVLRAANLKHLHYTAWGRLVGAGAPPPRVRHDPAYLAEAGAVARYDVGLGVARATLEGWGAALRNSDWSRPLGSREITEDMHTAGGRADIGPATRSQAGWLVSGDVRAMEYAIGQAEAAGSVPWHFWEEGAGWLEPGRWPRLWTDERGGPPPGGLAQQGAGGDTPWRTDAAHQPDLSYVPYLLTGRRAFLDGLLAQASWNIVSQWPGVRGTADRAGLGEGFLVTRDGEVRGSAWSLRQLQEAAWMAPDADRSLDWVRSANAVNWRWLVAQLPAWTEAQGESHGWIPGHSSDTLTMSPWQQDYFAGTAAAAARQGNSDALIVLRWMTNFLLGRFMSESRGFPRHDGVAYLIAIRADRPGKPILRSWTEIGRATRAGNHSNGTGWTKSDGNYGQLGLQSLAELLDLTGAREVRAAYDWLASAGAPHTSASAYQQDPTYSIVPRGRTRGPGPANACPVP
ncbi:MAG TPA: hypothetical protein VEY31_00210 [Roseococcus sp.]|nr:hypothetical protein [Roseococcus sp.]